MASRQIFQKNSCGYLRCEAAPCGADIFDSCAEAHVEHVVGGGAGEEGQGVALRLPSSGGGGGGGNTWSFGREWANTLIAFGTEKLFVFKMFLKDPVVADAAC